MYLKILVNLVLGMMVWLLLAPPQGKQERAPLSEWSRVGTYQSQAACEHEKKLWRSGTHRIKENRGEVSAGEVNEKIAPDSMVCVGDDDPRLKQTPR